MRSIHPLTFWAISGFLFGFANAVVRDNASGIAAIAQGLGGAIALTIVGSFFIRVNRPKKPWDEN